MRFIEKIMHLEIGSEFHIEKSDLKEIKCIIESVNYRVAKPVIEYIVFPSNCAFPICPKCKITFEGNYQKHCDRCGQMLKWISEKKVRYIFWNER